MSQELQLSLARHGGDTLKRRLHEVPTIFGQNELPRAKGSWAEPSWAEPSLSQERLVYEDHIQTLSAADRERRADPSDPTSKLPVMTRNKSQDEIKKYMDWNTQKGSKTSRSLK